MTTIADFPRIWCRNCSSVRPMIVDIMGADHMNDSAAADLMCSNCHFVIATLHEDNHAKTEALSAARSG